MEDNLYHPSLELFKHQLYFLGNVPVQYFLISSFYFSITFSYILLHKYFSETLSPYVCMIVLLLAFWEELMSLQWWVFWSVKMAFLIIIYYYSNLIECYFTVFYIEALYIFTIFILRILSFLDAVLNWYLLRNCF